jgi:hypothetical protein
MTVVEPAFARPNDGRYQKSGEAMKKADACDFYKGMLDLAEKEADKRAGTKAAKKYADLPGAAIMGRSRGLGWPEATCSGSPAAAKQETSKTARPAVRPGRVHRGTRWFRASLSHRPQPTDTA